MSVHSVEGEVSDPMTDEEMQESWKQIQVLNEELRSAGAWVVGGALHEPDTATVVHVSGSEVRSTVCLRNNWSTSGGHSSRLGQPYLRLAGTKKP